jgi:hypothetical protein
MPSNTSIIVFTVLLGLMVLFWLGQLGSLHDIHAGRNHANLASLFAVVLSLLTWAVLVALLVMAGTKGEMPGWTGLIAFVLHPASCAAAIAVSILMDSDVGKEKTWLAVVPAAAPLLMGAFASWAFFPAFRAMIPAAAAGSVTWGAVLLLAILPWPSVSEHSEKKAALRVENEAAAARAEKAALDAARQENLVKIQALGPETDLWHWMQFTDPQKGVREEAFAGIHNLKDRQKQAEDLIAQGLPGPLIELPNLGLEATPAIVQAHKARLLELASSNRRDDARTVIYGWIAKEVDGYLPATQWMAERHCGCATEVAALEAVVRSYADSPGREQALAALEKARAIDKN